MASNLTFEQLAMMQRNGVSAQLNHCIVAERMDLSVHEPAYTFGFILSQQRRQNETRWALPGRPSRPLRPNLFTFLPAGLEVHGDRSACDFECLRLDIAPDVFHTMTGMSVEDEELFTRGITFKSSVLLFLFRRFAHELKEPTPLSEEICAYLADCLMIEFARMAAPDPQHAQNEPSSLADWQLAKVKEAMIETEGFGGAKIASIAKKCGISGRHLMRGFKAVTGMTIHNYFDDVRFDRTKELLRGNELPLKAVASLVGFSSPAHMSTAFKRKLGITPSEYRTQTRN